MNARQAAKAAAKRIEELEHYNREAAQDIKDYNAVIESMIMGGSPCEWCEDINECQLEAKNKTGCKEWILRFRKEPVKPGQTFYTGNLKLDDFTKDDVKEVVSDEG